MNIRKYENLRQNLIYIINNCGLDIGAVEFILKDVYLDVHNLYEKQIAKEIEEEKKQSENNQAIEAEAAE